MKYIRTQSHGIVLFNDAIPHYVMSQVMGIDEYADSSDKVISAGFVDKDLNCMGSSTSLRKHSLEEDTAILKSQFS